jgi:hypothetical protein
MNGRLWLCSWLWLASGCVRIDVPPAPEPARAAPAGAVRVDVVCILPATGPAVSNGVLVARLYEYEPQRADSQAREVGRTTLPGISHRPGQESAVRFACIGRSAFPKAYYLTAVVYPEGAPAGQSGLYRLEGFQRVLASGPRETLRATLAPVPDEGEPTN